MKFELYKIDGKFDGKTCYVHARACALDENKMVMTTQKLNVRGDDSFGGLETLKSYDGGKTWTEPCFDPGLAPVEHEDGTTRLWCDATHLLHKKTGVPILIGPEVGYKPTSVYQVRLPKRALCYSTYDIEKECYTTWRRLELPEELNERFKRGLAPGCSQFMEDDNGDVLIPVMADEGGPSTELVIRCGFDGTTLTYKSISNELYFNVRDGIGEGSLVKLNGRYYLTIRNYDHGIWSVSDDGEHFTQPTVWRWDTGLDLPTYNTQSHLLKCGGKLYLVYTRRAGNNDHVFRNRAPLFMAEVNTENMTVLHTTERIVIPERGARLGNFDVTQFDDDHAMIIAAEWMQPVSCTRYGSDNTIWLCDVRAD